MGGWLDIIAFDDGLQTWCAAKRDAWVDEAVRRRIAPTEDDRMDLHAEMAMAGAMQIGVHVGDGRTIWVMHDSSPWTCQVAYRVARLMLRDLPGATYHIVVNPDDILPGTSK